MSVEIYVYYQVADANLAAALLAVEQALAASSGPRPRLLRREEENSAGQQTWMEIHGGEHAQSDEQRLAVALTPYLSGARHVERFQPLL
jgi:hypothetical protein